ncbi:P-loop containing nucleoside triphosphate hydrolase protein [Obba rivulosa]|uniref:P-loop containing nucleoside triphosphate hydrolase protein n=1 Tax=Obba rivulosa TaxID=1052685 RepID=A0A8E2DFW7_9APHY|nr:P-loop containing nucleoside triphosphate hydrolase protein [Obba rivulosa]
MDLDGFEGAVSKDLSHAASKIEDAKDALDYIDSEWYAAVNRRGRWMDLFGDYAGEELFIIDGDSLIQNVLDDPLLALGRDGDPSFQIVHAMYSLERLLCEIRKRSDVFEIIFWNDQRHLTTATGPPIFTFSSRTLARGILIGHLRSLGTPVHVFKNQFDPEWLSYLRAKKPMFIMVNDGGTLEDRTSPLLAERVLLQRIFLFDILSQGVTVTLLKGAEFRDSKLLSFVYEQRLDRDARKRLKTELWTISWSTLKMLDDAYYLLQQNEGLKSQEDVDIDSDSVPVSQEEFLGHFLKAVSLSSLSNIGHSHELLFAFMAHLLLVPQLPIHERALALPVLPDTLNSILLHTFLPQMFLALGRVHSRLRGFGHPDGRVFVHLLLELIRQPDVELQNLLAEDVHATLQSVWNQHSLPAVDLRSLSNHYHLPISSADLALHRNPPPAKLLPFEHPVFDEELAGVRVEVDEGVPDALPTRMGFNTIFNDTHHWHNHERAILPAHLGGEDPKPADERQRWRQLRSEQRFMSKMQWQATTLTGALGQPLKQMVIIPGNQRSKADSSVKTRVAQVHAPKKKGKPERLSSADKIRQANAAEKQSKEDASNQAWWANHVKQLDGLSLEQKTAIISDLQRNSRTTTGWMSVEIRLYKLHLELSRWVEFSDQEQPDVCDRFTVSVLRMVKDAYDKKGVFLAAHDSLMSVLTAIGLANFGPSLSEGAISDLSGDKDRRLSFKFIKLVKSKSGSPVYKFMRIKEDFVEWQLRLFGEFMDRSMDSQYDPRVSFEPDAWQRTVLDCLDKDESVLVVAPTSAGKTFVSYYAMEQVLRGSDDGILVYVAPTKALVNQIAAEVYARFRKELHGGSCWAIHTRDYRVHDPQKCQILVTVPEMLAIMLLSPPLASKWTPRIKRIILDEIHTIGQQEGGAVWEQIILLAPCPIIGLSATIGHPEKFNNWLASVQEAHGFKHNFIHHPHRYSHLRKFTYAASPEPFGVFRGLDRYVDTKRLRFMHPISMLSFGARTLPPDLSLEASDCLTLYRALAKVDQKTAVGLNALSPSVFFQEAYERRALLRQKDVLRYEDSLKTTLSALLCLPESQDATSVVSELALSLTDPVVRKMDQDYVPSAEEFYRNLIFLVSDLHVAGDLPALFFSFDRKACEHMAQSLLHTLEDAETKWRGESKEWADIISRWERWKLQAKARKRLAERAEKQRQDPDVAPDTGSEMTWESTFDPSEPSPQFSFAGNCTSYSKADLNAEIENLGRWGAVPSWALQALQRGIGVHHSGMNKHYRTLVESLYRVGFLRVVFATGTLALGINAPTKTSVFCGDSPFLTALMFRQCAGRAGRRGFDLLGKVVFYGLAMGRCQRLVLSRLPSLGGNFPLTSTMVLRLFNLLQGSKNAEIAVRSIRSLLQLPHISFISDVGQEQVLHHIRFSIDYLRRCGLLDRGGSPINLFGIAAHLYYTEPSNLALVALLRQGIIHRICCQDNIVTAREEFLIVMCHLFGRRNLPGTYASGTILKDLRRKSPSMIVLPPLPDDAKVVLLNHDQEILHVFAGYTLAYARGHASILDDDHELPLSKMSFGNRGQSVSQSSFREYLRSNGFETFARSPFVATSGHGDSFRSVEELTRTARTGLHLNEHAIPSMRQFVTGHQHALNAYLLDFYIHGQTAALKVSNGIREGEIWYLLQDFMLTLKTVRAGIVQLLQRSANGDGPESGDVDSGYSSVDPTDGTGESSDDNETIKRPYGVSDEDWKVYETIDAVTKEFEVKFKAMWA